MGKYRHKKPQKLGVGEVRNQGKRGIFIYPRCPKIDSFIERYNRTVQEEFIDYHEDVVHDKKLFNQKLADWNIYYNTKRRHHSLGLKSPLQHLVDKGGMSKMSVTRTLTCNKYYGVI